MSNFKQLANKLVTESVGPKIGKTIYQYKISWMLYEDDYEKGPDKLATKQSHYSGEIDNLDMLADMPIAVNNAKNIEQLINSGEYNRFIGSFQCDADGNFVDVTKVPTVYDAWKEGAAKLYVCSFVLAIRKVETKSLDENEINQVLKK